MSTAMKNPARPQIPPIEQSLKRLPKLRLSESEAQAIRLMLRDSGRFVAFHRRFVDVLASDDPNESTGGHAKAALLMSQVVYWIRHGTEIEQYDGWIRKTAEQWEIETGLSRREVDTARHRLKQLGLLEEKRAGLPALPHYKLNLERLGELLAARVGRSLPQSLSINVLRQKEEWVRHLMGPVVAYNRALVAICDSVNAALYLSQAIASQAAEMSANVRCQGWLVRSIPQVNAETGLSRHEQDTARRLLRAKGFLAESVVGVPPCRFTFVDLQKIADALQASNISFARDKQNQVDSKRKTVEKVDNTRLALSGKLDKANPEKQNGGERQISILGLKITALKAITSSPLSPTNRDTSPSGADREGVDENTVSKIDWSSLIFPRFLTGEEIVASQKALLRAPRKKWQQLLDELAGQKNNPNRRKAIENPVAYLRTLATQAQLGSFVPELASKVSQARWQAEQTAASLAITAKRNSEEVAKQAKQLFGSQQQNDGARVSVTAVAQMRELLKPKGDARLSDRKVN